MEYPYLAAETHFVPMGGETCNVNPPRSECATALSELGMFHYSYLNTDYEPSVLSGLQVLQEGAHPTRSRQIRQPPAPACTPAAHEHVER